MSKILTDLTRLAEAVSKDPDLIPEEKMDDVEFILKNLEAFPKYFNSVIMTETQVSMLRFVYEREDYIDRVQSIDQKRRDNHIGATDAINKINRRANYYGLEPIFKYPGCEERELEGRPKIDGIKNPELIRRIEFEAKEDRKIAADIVYKFCKDVFLDAKSKEKYNGKEEYDREERDEELYQIGKNQGHFKERLTLEDLFEEARQNAKDDEIIPNLDDIKHSF